MATTIVTKYGSDAPAASDLVRGELAVDTENGRLYTENSSGAVVEIGLNPEGSVTANAGISVDNINIDGTTIALSSGDLTLDSAGDITFDADGGDWRFKDAGTTIATYSNVGGSWYITSNSQDGDIVFQGNDGGSTIAALTLDMSAAGAATFNAGATFGGNVDVTGTVTADAIEIATTASDTGVELTLNGNKSSNGGVGSIIFENAGDSVGMIRSNRASANDAADMLFYTQATGGANTERFRIDSSGNFLVGKSSSSFGTDGFQANADGQIWATNASASVTAFNRRTTDGAISVFYKDGTSVGSISSRGGATLGLILNPASGTGAGLSGASNAIFPIDETTTPVDGEISLGTTSNAFKDLYLSGVAYNGDGSASAPSISFGADTNTGFYRVGSDQIGFVTAGTIKAKLDASGNLLVGGTSVGASDSCAIESYGEITIARASGVGRLHMTFTNGGTTVGTITTSGSATTYNTSSDQRLKDNIVDAPSASDDIDAIQVRSFDWKADGSHQKYGMVAQELQTVVPEAVSAPEDSEEMMGVDYSKLVPMMLKEIQSLRARVAQLES